MTTKPAIIKIPHKRYIQEALGPIIQMVSGYSGVDETTRRLFLDVLTAQIQFEDPRELQNYLEIERAFQHYVNNIVTVIAGNNGTFGDGSDGSLHFDGSTTILGMAPSAGEYTVTRNIYATDITVDGGVLVKTRSFRIFCQGTCTNNGTIHANGLAPVGFAAGVGGGGNGGGNNVYYTSSNQSGAGGGGFGTGSQPLGGSTINSVGGSGGAGGSAASGGIGTGVPNSTATPPIENVGGLPRIYTQLVLGTNSAGTKLEAGVGGTGGSSAGSPAQNGAAGGGGGIVGLFAKTLVNNGTISANGGAGGAAGGASGNAGGGGGGGGGGVFIVCGPGSVQGTMTATGASGGSGRGLGGAGGTGANGRVFFVQ